MNKKRLLQDIKNIIYKHIYEQEEYNINDINYMSISSELILYLDDTKKSIDVYRMDEALKNIPDLLYLLVKLYIDNNSADVVDSDYCIDTYSESWVDFSILNKINESLFDDLEDDLDSSEEVFDNIYNMNDKLSKDFVNNVLYNTFHDVCLSVRIYTDYKYKIDSSGSRFNEDDRIDYSEIIFKSIEEIMVDSGDNLMDVNPNVVTLLNNYFEKNISIICSDMQDTLDDMALEEYQNNDGW